MKTIAKPTSGGSNAAKPEINNLNNNDDPAMSNPGYRGLGVDGIGHDHPFIEADHNDPHDTDVDSTTRCRNWEDVTLRNSYFFDPNKSDDPQFIAYALDPYGILRIALIAGQAWVSVDDAGRFAGVPTSEITGYLPEGFEHVRGYPGFLKPDGVRNFNFPGLEDIAIRLEALSPHFMRAREGRILTEWLLKDVMPDVYADGLLAADVEPLSPFAAAESFMMQPDKLTQFRIYNTFRGEFRAVVIGNQVWIHLVDVSRRSHLEPTVVAQIAGESRMVSIPNADVAYAESAYGATKYVRLDAVSKLLQATDYLNDVVNMLGRWLTKRLLSSDCQLASGRFVHASTLHQMFGKHLDFSAWVAEVFTKNGDTLDRLGIPSASEPVEDFKILLTEAREIAKREGGFAGQIVGILIREGGFFHSGPVTESMDATLRRFQGLLPDRNGRVEIRKVHEFLNVPDSFEEWLQSEREDRDSDSAAKLEDELISQDMADWCGLWRKDLTFYPECLSGHDGIC